ncbi:MAG: tetratricopeptide repeat protein [bacterium]
MKKIVFYLLAGCLLISCSASKKALKEARKYEKAGLYVEAAEYDLKALDKKPDFNEALVHLNEVAPKAYYELIKRSSNLEAAENWDQAVSEYERLQTLLRRFNHYGVVLETVNVKQRLNRAQQKAAAHHYAIAENFFSNKVWKNAAYAYLKANDYIDNYHRSFEKAIQAFLNSGNEGLKQKKYDNAFDSFLSILEIAPNHPVATRGVAETHYRLGRHLYKEERFREALAHFEQCQEFVPDYRDADRWARTSYESAVQYVGIFPFLNQTRFAVDGYFIASEIESRVFHENLKFLELLPHPEVVALVRELRRSRRNSVSESEILTLARREDLNAVVWGKVRDLSIEDTPTSFEEHEYRKTVVVQDTSGNDIEKSGSIFYREYSKSRLVRMEVQYYILDAESGTYLDEDRLREEVHDEAHWIAYQGSINDLPKKKRKYLDAQKDVRDKYVLINELLESISKRISRRVVRFYQ